MHTINNADEGMTHTRPLIPDVPFHPGSTSGPLPKVIDQPCQEVRKVHKVHQVWKILIQISIQILRKILHFKKALSLKLFKDQTNSLFQEPKELNDPINTDNLIQKFLPKQADTDRILKVIQRKVLRGTCLLVEIKEIQARYLMSSHFKDIYVYLSQNKLPTSKTAIRKVEILAKRCILLDSLLFKITPEKESVVLAVPETCANKIITLLHSSLFAGHQGVIKTYLTISNIFSFQTSYIFSGLI